MILILLNKINLFLINLRAPVNCVCIDFFPSENGIILFLLFVHRFRHTENSVLLPSRKPSSFDSPASYADKIPKNRMTTSRSPSRVVRISRSKSPSKLNIRSRSGSRMPVKSRSSSQDQKRLSRSKEKAKHSKSKDKKQSKELIITCNILHHLYCIF